jgi:hypothetical protein
MRYLKVRWLHHLVEEPMVLYSELDESAYECRKVEVYRGGRHDYADQSTSTGTTMLGTVPVPEIAVIAAEDEFDPCLITRAEFERVWVRATGRPQPAS